MKLAVPLVVVVGVGCGSSSKPAVEQPVDTAPKKVTRVPIEDETANGESSEDGVTFVKTKGSITKEAIQTGLAPHAQGLTDCYMTKVGKRRWLGGHVVLEWILKADGTVASAKMIESDLGSAPIEQCMLDIAWSVTFPKPSGGDADFTLPFDFSPTRSAQIWDEDKTLRAIGGQLAALDDCNDFEFEPKPAPKAKKGKKAPAKKAEPDDDKPARPEKAPSNVVMTMYVGPGGKLQSVGFASATTEVGQKWAACAEQVASSWRLPDPRGQIAKLAIRYKAE